MYKQLSDLDYVNGKPAIEWDTDMGRFWETFDSEEAREAELTRYTEQYKLERKKNLSDAYSMQ